MFLYSPFLNSFFWERLLDKDFVPTINGSHLLWSRSQLLQMFPIASHVAHNIPGGRTVNALYCRGPYSKLASSTYLFTIKSLNIATPWLSQSSDTSDELKRFNKLSRVLDISHSRHSIHSGQYMYNHVHCANTWHVMNNVVVHFILPSSS